jgi:wobble nucleotide-excising tRNase
MLERISDIQGIGLLHQANGKPFTCKNATLIYGDNGRGKSTLATILRSVATGDPLIISGCKTIDGTLPVKVNLQFGNGHLVSFQNGAWTERRPELLVFDADFIGRNVHSGGAVNTDHRKNLLDFALGDPAVTARQAVDKATSDSKDASEKVSKLTDQLSGHHVGMLIAQFEQLAQVNDIDAKVADLQKRAVAAGSVAAIQARPVPSVVAEPTLDIDGLFEVLGTSLQDIHAEAEKTVKLHVLKLGKAGAESWLSQGRQYSDGVSCPFCNQDISTNDLVSAYQTHFNAAYANLKSRVAEVEQKLLKGTADSTVTDFSKSLGVAVAQAKAWIEQVPTQDIPFDTVAASDKLKELREFLVGLVSKKQAAPAESFGSATDKATAVGLWAQFLSHLEVTNSALKETALLINNYKTRLSGDSVVQLQQQIQLLEATKRRYDPQVVALFAKLVVAKKEAKAAEAAKKTAREALETLMVAILAKYQTAINALLKKFGASFSIKGMNANFRGNAPRTEYGLLLRGKDVVLEGGPPSFATTLSDGDKRTLAFAFFVACTLDDPKLAQRIVVIDDPMCSLDMARRQHTRMVLKQIRAKAEQVVILAHDAYFIRDLRDAFLKEDKTSPIAIFQLTGTTNGYTDFAAIEIDKECESVYAQHHRLLNQYSSGTGSDHKAVSKAIRPMLEGYLHRRFPGLLPKDHLFGQVVILIRDAAGSSPLCHAQNLVAELNEINDYAGQFHHDTNPDADSTAVTPSELKTYVGRVLDVVYKGTA